jgi:hypothetical protein
MDKIEITFRLTPHQVPRGALADADANGRIYLFKNVSVLHLTYQIKLLAFRASNEGKKLVIRIPRHTALTDDLRSFVNTSSRLIQIDRATQ